MVKDTTRKTRNTPPRNVVFPKENIEYLGAEKVQDILDSIALMRSEDLLLIMNAVSSGLIRQRDLASHRAIDFEAAVANIARASNPTPQTYRFVLDEFIKPHESALRMGKWLIDTLEKRASKGEKS